VIKFRLKSLERIDEPEDGQLPRKCSKLRVTLEKFNALIIEPDIDARMRIKQATLAVPKFGHLQSVNSISDAISQVEYLDNSVDIIFVSKRIPHEKMQGFFQFARASKKTEDAANVVLFQSQDEGNALIKTILELGADGILCEPYSVDQLSEIAELATFIKRERAKERERGAISLLIDDLAKQVDLVSVLSATGGELGQSRRVLLDLSRIAQGLSESGKEFYFERIIEKFSNLPPPPKAFQASSYNGASERVKRLLSKKRAQLMKGKNESTNS